jgi:hypothetical protein
MNLPPRLTCLLAMSTGIGIGLMISPARKPAPAGIARLSGNPGFQSAEDPTSSMLVQKSAVNAFLPQDRKSDLTASWQAAGNLTDPGERLVARQLVLANAARINPETALGWLALHPEAATPDLVEMLAPRLPAKNFSEALQWTSTLPEALRPAAATAMIRRWGQLDPVESARLIDAFSGKPGHDEMIRTFALSIGTSDSSSAIEWSRTISNPQLRDATQKELLENWNRVNPIAVRRWLDASHNATDAEISQWRDDLDQVELTRY